MKMSVLKPDFTFVISTIEEIMQGKDIGIDGVVVKAADMMKCEFSEIVEKLEELRDRLKNAIANDDRLERNEELANIVDELKSW
jgi:hypothetical protein